MLATMTRELQSLNSKSVIHLELASIGNDEFMKEILNNVRKVNRTKNMK